MDSNPGLDFSGMENSYMFLVLPMLFKMISRRPLFLTCAPEKQSQMRLLGFQ